MKKQYIQPSLVITPIATNNVCITSVHGNLDIKIGKAYLDFDDAV